MTAYSQTTPTIKPRWQAGMTYVSKSKYTIGTGVVTADTFTFSSMLPPLSNAVEVQRVRIYGQEADTNAAPTATIVVGDGTTANAYVKSKTWGNALAQFAVEGDGDNIGTTITVSRDIVATLGGTVATAASSGDVWCEVEYYCVGK